MGKIKGFEFLLNKNFIVFVWKACQCFLQYEDGRATVSWPGPIRFMVEPKTQTQIGDPYVAPQTLPHIWKSLEYKMRPWNYMEAFVTFF